ncbi:MAG: flagellar biosynthetic protein FliR [Granulosicoccus sp.]|nr:flagellar biosynthetic protein FliR [Granulosicoccus sp.]
MNALAISIAQISEMVTAFFWPLVRVAGVLSVAPILGSPRIPSRIRASIAVVLTISMLSLTGPVPDIDPLSLAGVAVTLSQLLIGLLIGFILLLVFNVLIVAGESIAAAMGLGFALMSDPSSGVQIPVISQFFSVLATLLFLVLDGHHALINLIASSFQMLPVTDSLNAEGLWIMISWSGVLFSGAMMVALPALVTMLCVNIIMGVMTRAAPQLNIFSVGFPVTMTLGFVVILITLPGMSPAFETLLSQGFDKMSESLLGLVP